VQRWGRVAAERERIEALATVTLDARTLEQLGPKTLDRLADLVAERLARRGHDGLLCTAAAAELAGVSASTIRRAIRSGAIEVFGYVGNRPRLQRSAVEEWIACGSPRVRTIVATRAARAMSGTRAPRRVLGEALGQLDQAGAAA
jgi:excisionase family DNA binding protein